MCLCLFTTAPSCSTFALSYRHLQLHWMLCLTAKILIYLTTVHRHLCSEVLLLWLKSRKLTRKKCSLLLEQSKQPRHFFNKHIHTTQPLVNWVGSQQHRCTCHPSTHLCFCSPSSHSQWSTLENEKKQGTKTCSTEPDMKCQLCSRWRWATNCYDWCADGETIRGMGEESPSERQAWILLPLLWSYH